MERGFALRCYMHVFGKGGGGWRSYVEGCTLPVFLFQGSPPYLTRNISVL